MELLISPKTQIITLIQSLVLTWGHWRFKGDHTLAATWTRSWSHRWGRSLMVWSAARKAESGSVTVKAAGEEKRDEGQTGQAGVVVKWWKASPWARGARGHGLPHCRGHRQVLPLWWPTPCWVGKAVAASLRRHWPHLATLNLPTPVGSVTSLLGVFPVVTLAQDV